MIKPIIYHNIAEKEALERKLMAGIPYEERLANWNAIMSVFAPQVKQVTRVTRKGKSTSK